MLKKLLMHNIIHIFFVITALSACPAMLQAMEPSAKMSINTLHFQIYYKEEMPEAASFAAAMAEDSYMYLADYLHHDLSKTVQLIVNGPQDNPDMLFFSDSPERIRITFRGSYISFHRELSKKLARTFIYSMIYGSFPDWNLFYYKGFYNAPYMIEPLSDYLSSGFDMYSDMIIRNAVKNDNAHFMNIRYIGKDYTGFRRNISKSFFYFMESVYGKDSIGRFIRNISSTGNEKKSLQLVTGRSTDELNREWINFFRNRNIEDKPAYKSSKVQPDIVNIALNNNYYCSVSSGIYRIFKMHPGQNNDPVLSYKQNGFSGIDSIENFPSVSSDNKIIFAKDQCRSIVVFDAASGKDREIKFPFEYIKDASVSADGKSIIFTGRKYRSSDIYLFDIEKMQLVQLTNDLYTKRYPKLSPDNNFIVFSSNENDDKNPEAVIYKLIKLDLKTNIKTVISAGNAHAPYPDISQSGKRIIYNSDASAFSRIYCYDVSEEKSRQAALSDAFYPRWLDDGNKFICSVYSDFAYNLSESNINADAPEVKETPAPPGYYKNIEYAKSYFDRNDAVTGRYSDNRDMYADLLVRSLIWGGGYAGALSLITGDSLNEYRIKLNADFTACSEYDKYAYLNLDAEFEYLKFVPDFGIGIYRKYPMIVFSADNTDVITQSPDNINSSYTGAYIYAAYPVTGKMSVKLAGSAERCNDVIVNGSSDDIYFQYISASIDYSNLYGRIWPEDGGKFSLKMTHNFYNNTGFSSESAALNFQKLFRFDDILVLSVKGGAGRIFGDDSGYYKYYLGGINSIRGYALNSLCGRNSFLFDTEIRLKLWEKCTLCDIRFNDMNLVLFADLGSAWDKNYSLMNSKGEFDDLKAGIGGGFRFLIQDHIAFKTDAAWPYYYKSFGKMEIYAGFDFLY